MTKIIFISLLIYSYNYTDLARAKREAPIYVF